MISPGTDELVRSILIAGAPILAALAVCAAGLVLLLRFSRLRWNWQRVARLPADDQGGVQSLAFVMTFPIFLLLVLFIVQLSQLMIGVVLVHYAAFASARAASVWIPADVDDAFRMQGGDSGGQNELPAFVAPGGRWTISQQVVEGLGDRKIREIWSAAALACVPLAPSKPTSGGGPLSTLATGTASSLTLIVQALDPAARNNAVLPRRLTNKVSYSFANTTVELQFVDRTSQGAGGATYNPLGHPRVEYLPSEVGWQDPVTVTVRHKFALLPGPGRWLAAGLANRDGRIVQEDGLYKTTLTASATMTVEGLQSLRPTLHAAQ